MTGRVHDRCLCFHVHRAARVLARRFDDAMRPLDLTNGQFSLLMALNQAAPPSMSGVASLLAMDRTTLIAALKPLTRRGLVNVAVNDADRRTRSVTLTTKGRRLLARAVPVWEQTHLALEAQLDRGQARHLRESLEAFAKTQ